MRYILFHKPYHVLSQFTGEGLTLSSFGLPKNVYAAGRLDKDSEGLLFLTDDGRLKHRLLDPVNAHERVYMVQVEGIPTTAILDQLEQGVVLDGRPTAPARVQKLGEPKNLPARTPPVRFRKTVPTSWLEIRLTEGKNRQVRRMTASVGLPTLRLIRTKILFLTLDGMAPGTWRDLSPTEIRKLKRETGL